MEVDDTEVERQKAIRSRHLLFVVLLVGLSAGGIGCVAWYWPYLQPQSYVAAVEKAGTPVVTAIDAYIARVGYPPEHLSDLQPEFDAKKAGTGFPRQDVFEYRTWRTGGKRPDNSWALWVWAEEPFILDCDEIRFTSTTRTWEFVVVH